MGTFLLTFFGCGCVCAAVLTGAQIGVFQVAIVWGPGIALAIHLAAPLSGAHLHPDGQPLTPAARERISPWAAFLAEVLGTAVLLLVVLGLTDARNPTRPRNLTPAPIGLTVTTLISPPEIGTGCPYLTAPPAGTPSGSGPGPAIVPRPTPSAPSTRGRP